MGFFGRQSNHHPFLDLFEALGGLVSLVQSLHVKLSFDVLEIPVRKLVPQGQNKKDVFLAQLVHFVGRRVGVLHEVELQTALEEEVVKKVGVGLLDPEVQQRVELLVLLDHLVVDSEVSEIHLGRS